jgi:hypothetical protein
MRRKYIIWDNAMRGFLLFEQANLPQGYKIVPTLDIKMASEMTLHVAAKYLNENRYLLEAPDYHN